MAVIHVIVPLRGCIKRWSISTRMGTTEVDQVGGEGALRVNMLKPLSYLQTSRASSSRSSRPARLGETLHNLQRMRHVGRWG